MAFKPSGELDITDNHLVFSGETESQIAEDDTPKTRRQKLDIWLNLIVVQTVVVIVVFIDVLIITTLLLIDLKVIQDPHDAERGSVNKRDVGEGGFTQETTTNSSPSPLSQAENILHIINMVILSAFIIEILLRVIGKGWDMIYDKLQIFDCLVVLVTFVLYMSLAGAILDRTVAYGTCFLIVLRLWRMHRIRKDLTKPVVKHAHRIIVAHRKAVKNTEENNKKLVAKTKSLEREVQNLRDSLQNLSIASGSIIPQSPIRRSHMSLDTVTSEDDYDTSYHQTPGTLTVEVVNHQRRYAANGGHTPSQPGTPISATSSLYGFDNFTAAQGYDNISSIHGYEGVSSTDGVTSEGSSGKIPDIVEDTQHPPATLSRSCSRENGVGDIGLPDSCVTESVETFAGGLPPPSSPPPPPPAQFLTDSGDTLEYSNNGARSDTTLNDGAITTDSILLAKDYGDFSRELTESGIFPGSSIHNSEMSFQQGLPPGGSVTAATGGAAGSPEYIPSISETVVTFPPPPPPLLEHETSAWPGSEDTAISYPLPPPLPPHLPPHHGVTNPFQPTSTSPTYTTDYTTTGAIPPVISPEQVVLRDKPSLTISAEQSRADTVQLIKERVRSRDDLTAEDFSFLNAAFGSLTEEELNEIRRVSLVPFEYGSISVLTKEGIPMTDL